MAEKTITVTKTATEKVAADWVVVSVSAVGESKKYAEAADKADSVADAAVAALKAVGGADVRAHGINVGAIRDGKKTVGYRAVRTFSVEFDYDKKTLAAVLDALAESSCEFGVSFSLKDKELHA